MRTLLAGAAHGMTRLRARASGRDPSRAGHGQPRYTGDPLLVADRLGVTYHAGGSPVEAVADVSFTMPADERLVIIGPSGCGKSTLLRTVGGFQVPTSGRVAFDGREDLEPGPDRAMVFQELDQLFPWQTVIDNIARPIRYRGTGRSPARARALEYLELMGLAHAAARYPHELSGGMKQRVAIARALALRPRLLLMDEPFGSLDAITRARLQREVREMSRRLGVAVLFVTHSLDEALTIGDRVLVLGHAPSTLRGVVPVPAGDSSAAGRAEAHRHLRDLLGGTGPAAALLPEARTEAARDA
ncbi:MAG: ATP-binding cassette domain-containing protein [Actinobacteria bacterium]|nr:ATP-binding cassette domain-containing protein [Actinomycetota bacterium]MBO0785836.1 ATP-binding cassette domain-containing protein [Actinomycetota bacterium]